MFRTTCGPDNPIFKKLSDSFLDFEIDTTKLAKYEYGTNIELDSVAMETLKQIAIIFLWINFQEVIATN